MRNIENFDELFYVLWFCKIYLVLVPPDWWLGAASAGSGLHWGSQSWPLRSCLQSLLSPLARHQPAPAGGIVERAGRDTEWDIMRQTEITQQQPCNRNKTPYLRNMTWALTLVYLVKRTLLLHYKYKVMVRRIRCRNFLSLRAHYS